MRKTLINNRPGITDPLGRAAIVTPPGLGTGRRKIMPLGIERRRMVSDPVHGARKVGHDLVLANKQHHLLRAERDAAGAVADHIEIDQLAAGGDGVGTGEEEVGEQRLAAALHDLLAGHTGFKGLDHLDLRVCQQLVQHPGGLHSHRIGPGDQTGLDAWQNLGKKDLPGLRGISGDEYVKAVGRKRCPALLQCCRSYRNRFSRMLKKRVIP